MTLWIERRTPLFSTASARIDVQRSIACQTSALQKVPIDAVTEPPILFGLGG